MSGGCCNHDIDMSGQDAAFRRALIAVIAINAVMFMVELPLGFLGESESLKADSLDFLGDTLTYALSLAVLGQSLMWRARAALFKAGTLALMGLWVLASTLYQFFTSSDPAVPIMASVAIAALLANLTSVLLLLRFRDGDSNIRSVWLCSRNDAVGNVAVLAAAGVVTATNSRLPDLIVAAFMASLFVNSASRIVVQALGELRHAKDHAAEHPAK